MSRVRFVQNLYQRLDLVQPLCEYIRLHPLDGHLSSGVAWRPNLVVNWYI